MWSLACVITLVLTFLHNGSEGIIKLQESRGRDRSHDWFFGSKALRSGSANKEILHASVYRTQDVERPETDLTEMIHTVAASVLIQSHLLTPYANEGLSG